MGKQGASPGRALTDVSLLPVNYVLMILCVTSLDFTGKALAFK